MNPREFMDWLRNKIQGEYELYATAVTNYIERYKHINIAFAIADADSAVRAEYKASIFYRIYLLIVEAEPTWEKVQETIHHLKEVEKSLQDEHRKCSELTPSSNPFQTAINISRIGARVELLEYLATLLQEIAEKMAR